MCEEVHNTTDIDDGTGGMSLEVSKIIQIFRSSKVQKYALWEYHFFVCMYSEEPIYHLSWAFQNLGKNSSGNSGYTIFESLPEYSSLLPLGTHISYSEWPCSGAFSLS